MMEPPRWPEDRRGFPRRQYKTIAVVYRSDDGISTGQVLNVSLTGAMILIRGVFDDREVVHLVLQGIRKQAVMQTAATIRWRHEEGGDVFRIGVKFHRRLSDKELSSV